MSEDRHDVIVVGARCAGSPTAMLLAREGYKVLVVDRATFPSDTVSTHLLHPPGVAALARWGLLERLAASGCPPIGTYVFDFGPFTISGSPGTAEAPVAYAPPADGARPAASRGRGRGRGRGPPGLQRARGAGRGGTRHRDPGPRRQRPQRHRARPGGCRCRRAALAGRPDRPAPPVRRVAAAAVRLLLLLERAGHGRPLPDLGPPRPQLRRLAHPRRPDPGHRRLALPRPRGQPGRRRGQLPEDAGAGSGLRRPRPRRHPVAGFVGAAVPNYFRQPYGPGWALVGDAGYNKDFITAQGMHDAFRDAELCATALHECFSGPRPFDDAMGAYQATRDAQVLPTYELTAQLATLQPPPPELAQLLGAIHGHQRPMDEFAQVMAGVLSPAEFFSEEHVSHMLASAR